MDAGLKEPGNITEDGIGLYIFGSDGATTVQEGAGVEDNRHLLQDLLICTKTVLTNTFSENSQRIKSSTDWEKKPEQTPLTKGRFDVIDCRIVHKRWHNSVKHVYTDLFAGIDSDHDPLTS